MADPLTLDDFEAIARETLPAMTYDFIAGGAEDERSVAGNRSAAAGALYTVSTATSTRLEDLLRAELDLAMALVGAPSLAALEPDLVV